MKKRTDFRPFPGTSSDYLGFGSTSLLAAFLFLLGTGGNPSAADEDTLGGGVSTEQTTRDSVTTEHTGQTAGDSATTEQDSDDGVSADTDVKTSGDTGDCHVSAHASASSTSNGETVSRQSEKKVDGPCGKASASAKASSSNRAGGTSNTGN